MSDLPETRRIWTLRIRGGSPFEMKPASNPLIRHDGKLSVVHIESTKTELLELCQWISDYPLGRADFFGFEDFDAFGALGTAPEPTEIQPEEGGIEFGDDGENI